MTSSDGWHYLLGGTCHRNVPHDRVDCGSPTGIHGPWMTSTGKLVKFRGKDNRIIAAAIAAWHPGVVDGSLADVADSGDVTVSLLFSRESTEDRSSVIGYEFEGGECRAALMMS